LRLLALMPTAATVLAVGYSLSGCGGTSGGPPASSVSTPATVPAATTTTTTTPAKSKATPSAHDVAVAKAICAEPFYAKAFDSVDQCETAMSDPRAVPELKSQIEDYGKP
jgi:hypothetical protein